MIQAIMNKRDNQRLVWVDWMKTLAMYLIIAGHYDVPGAKFIYVFSVPCFFILSGFLNKREKNYSIFFGKLWWNLVVPMFLFTIIILFFHMVLHCFTGRFEWHTVYLNLSRSVFGYVSEGLWRMWFVYTLIICKVIYQFLNINKYWWILIGLLFLWLSTNVHTSGIEANAYLNVLLAMPFFILGAALRPLRKQLSILRIKNLIFSLFVSLVVVCICWYYNGTVMLYRCFSGGNAILCVIGGLAGTVSVYTISMLFRKHLAGFAEIVGGVQLSYWQHIMK